MIFAHAARPYWRRPSQTAGVDPPSESATHETESWAVGSFRIGDPPEPSNSNAKSARFKVQRGQGLPSGKLPLRVTKQNQLSYYLVNGSRGAGHFSSRDSVDIRPPPISLLPMRKGIRAAIELTLGLVTLTFLALSF